jgi:hypothetical protein
MPDGEMIVSKLETILDRLSTVGRYLGKLLPTTPPGRWMLIKKK